MTSFSPGSPYRPEALRILARELSLWALAPLVIAVFAIFSVLGPVADLLGGAQEALPALLWNSLLSGLVAVGYLLSILRRRYVLLGTIIVGQAVWIAIASHATHAAEVPASTGRLAAEGVLIMVQVIVSYTFFLIFINGTARRYLRIRAEVDLAHQIHQVLVPAVDRRICEFEFLGFSRPSGEVGGDLVDVVGSSASAGASAGWFGYVADVSGHGVSSGLVMGMFKSALRMRLRQPGALADLLKDLNSVLLPLRSGSMFVTLSCVRYAPDAALEYAVAGHLPILRVRGGVVDEITTAQIPIAMFDTYSFTSSMIDVQTGDLIALITDGLVEVFNRQDREFGLERVKSLLVAHAAEPLSQIADRLVSAARAHGKQLDDQTLLLIRRLEAGGRRSEVRGRRSEVGGR